jgi:Subunit ChlI of Mg-chelatase
MLYKTLSAAVYGIDANIIQVEVDCSGIKTDQDHFHTVGLPDAAVRESRDRVRAALKNCGYDIPPTHITINLAPADIKKEGSGFDLPMALGIVGAYGGLTKKRFPIVFLWVNCRSMAAFAAFVALYPSHLRPAAGKFRAWSFPKLTPAKLPWWAELTSIPYARFWM